MYEWYCDEENNKTYRELILHIIDDRLKFNDREIMFSSYLHEIKMVESSVIFRYIAGEDIDFKEVRDIMKLMMFNKFKEHMKENERKYLNAKRTYNLIFKKEIRLEKLNRIIEDE